MKIFFASLIAISILIPNAYAQYAAQNDAVYLATLKAVVNYKIDDEETIKGVEALRQDQRFMQELAKMQDKLSNRRSKNAINNRVYKILLKAGKEIYNELK